MRRTSAMCLALLWIGTPAGAQDEPLLEGPEVPREERRTLVNWTMTGEFRRVEGRPEAAAVQLLDLDERTRERAAELIDARNAAVATLLVDRIDDVKAITDAATSGAQSTARELLRAIWTDFDQDGVRSPLAPELRELLDDNGRAEMDRLLDEYWSAWIDWESRGEMDEAETPRERPLRRERTSRRLAFQLFQEEVRAAYELTLRRYRDVLEGIYQAVEPTGEQRRAIRDVVIEHIKATRLKATPHDRRAAMHEVYDLLDDERRAKLFDYILRVAVPDGG